MRFFSFTGAACLLLIGAGLGQTPSVMAASALAAAPMQALARDPSSGEILYRQSVLASADEHGLAQYAVVCETTEGRVFERSSLQLDSANGKALSLDWQAGDEQLELYRSDKRWIARRQSAEERERASYPRLRSSDVIGWFLAEQLRSRLEDIRNGEWQSLTHVQLPSLRRKTYRLVSHVYWRGESEIVLVKLSPKGWLSADEPAMSFEFSATDHQLLRYRGPASCGHGWPQDLVVELKTRP